MIPEFIKELEAQFGFDKPPLERFLGMLWNYARFEFGESYFRDVRIIDLIAEKLPVSISLGIWMTLISYLISIPLGIKKAVSDGSRFDIWTSAVIIVAYAIPGFLFAVLLIVLFAGGSFWDWFPLRGLTSDNWEQLSWPARILDYFWHLALPLTAMVLSAFATLTLLTKNSLFGRNSQTIRDNRPSEGAERAPGALRTRVPQCHVDCGGGISGGLYFLLFRRVAVDRNDLLARRSGASGL